MGDLMGIDPVKNGNGKKLATISGIGGTALISLIMYINTQVSNMKDEMIDKIDSLRDKEEEMMVRTEDALSDIKEQLSVMQIHVKDCR